MVVQVRGQISLSLGVFESVEGCRHHHVSPADRRLGELFMANRAAHLTVGTVTGLGLAGYLARNEAPVAFATETAGGAVGGAIGSLTPDWIEPALHSWHRSIAHSCTAATALATGSVRCLGQWQQHCRARAASHDEARTHATTDAARL